METIRQCWAHSEDGARCEHPAGHPGNHMISKEWADDECFSPIKHQLPAPELSKTGMSAAPIPNPEPLVEKCAACSHSHKSGACKCGCYEHIG
jgi:hypothetical protein